MKRASVFVGLVMVLLGIAAAGLYVTSSAATFADPAMETVWAYSDKPVSEQKASRTWMWGPEPFSTQQEAYQQAQGGTRLVSYYDKSRMEITDPNVDRTSPWFVTNGLLTKELITGQMQTGDASFESRSPARIPVAGDPDDQQGPTYESFAAVLGSTPHATGDEITDTLVRSGEVGTHGPTGVTAAYLVTETNHTVASVFWESLNSRGLVYENGDYHDGSLFSPTFYATGYPVAEAYWSQVKVGGTVKWVLMQPFERRVLTYTPDNPDGWKVEMGNVGRHYYDWRYNQAAPTPAPTVAPQPTPDRSDISGKMAPKSGPVGTKFQLYAWGFEMGEMIKFYVTSPNGKVTPATIITGDGLALPPGTVMKASPQGRAWGWAVKYENQWWWWPGCVPTFTPPGGSQLGWWQFTAESLDNGRKVTLWFDVTK